jgi:hypothetical protein
MAQQAPPMWDVVPTPQEALASYPAAALQDHNGAEVRLACRHDKAGALQLCQVESEIPAGHGFGAAALSLAPKYRLNPHSKAVEALIVRLPLFFPGLGANPPTRSLVFKPSTGRFARTAPAGPYWPELALRVGAGGSAQIDCRVGNVGRLTDCRLVNQIPIDIYFGPAALKMASTGWMTAGPKPEGVDEPVDGYWRFEVVYPRKTMADAG